MVITIPYSFLFLLCLYYAPWLTILLLIGAAWYTLYSIGSDMERGAKIKKERDAKAAAAKAAELAALVKNGDYSI